MLQVVIEASGDVWLAPLGAVRVGSDSSTEVRVGRASVPVSVEGAVAYGWIKSIAC